MSRPVLVEDHVLSRGSTVVRRRDWSVRWRRRHLVVNACLGTGLLLLLGAALVIGAYRVSAADAFWTLLGDPPAPRTEFFVNQRRLPRALVAVTVGASLAVSGALFQRLTRNPLASPDIIGVSGGAAVGAVLVVIRGGSPAAASLGAFVGALLAATLLLAAAARGGLTGSRLVLLGVAVGAFCAGLVDHLLNRTFVASAVTAQTWVVGTLQGRGWPELRPMVLGLLVVAPVLAAVAPRLRLLGLGDELAQGLGVRVTGLRWVALLAATALVAVAVSVSGPIAFVALVAPHAAARLVPDPGLFTTGLLGGLLLLGADLLAQHAFGVAVPVGVVTAVLGGVFFLVLLVRQGLISRG